MLMFFFILSKVTNVNLLNVKGSYNIIYQKTMQNIWAPHVKPLKKNVLLGSLFSIQKKRFASLYSLESIPLNCVSYIK